MMIAVFSLVICTGDVYMISYTMRAGYRFLLNRAVLVFPHIYAARAPQNAGIC